MNIHGYKLKYQAIKHELKTELSKKSETQSVGKILRLEKAKRRCATKIKELQAARGGREK